MYLKTFKGIPMFPQETYKLKVQKIEYHPSDKQRQRFFFFPTAHATCATGLMYRVYFSFSLRMVDVTVNHQNHNEAHC